MMAYRRRSAKGRTLKRKVAVRQPRKTFVIFCEGERTEPEYLQALKRKPSVRDVAAVDIRVETGRGGAPLTLVSLAADARSRAISEEAEIDEFWCVFDVEWPVNHPNLKEAIDQARYNEIGLAVSNPSFELWLILHFKDQNRWLNNDQADKLRKRLDGSRDKGLDAEKYMTFTSEAARRAAKLDERHSRDGSPFPNNNPSSGMYRLLAAVES
jgi:hypothetical protein